MDTSRTDFTATVDTTEIWAITNTVNWVHNSTSTTPSSR